MRIERRIAYTKQDLTLRLRLLVPRAFTLVADGDTMALIPSILRVILAIPAGIRL